MISIIYIVSIKSSSESCLWKPHLDPYPILYVIIVWSIILPFQALYTPRFDILWNVQIAVHDGNFFVAMV